MGRGRIKRKPCDAEALYHARELVKYTNTAIKSEAFEDNLFLAVFGEKIYQSIIEIYSNLVKTNDELDPHKKLDLLKTTNSNIDNAESLIESVVYVMPSVIKNMKQWSLLIDNTRAEVKRWITMINKEIKSKDKNEFIQLQHIDKG